MRQALAAILGIAGQRGPARLRQSLVSFLIAFRRGHRTVGMQDAAFLVATQIERRHHTFGELGGFLDDSHDGFAIGVGEALQVGILIGAEHVLDQELVVAHGSLIGHLDFTLFVK